MLTKAANPIACFTLGAVGVAGGIIAIIGE